jgi:cell division topological specificity factor
MMVILNYFKAEQKKSANQAKERLQVIIAHQRFMRNSPDYLPRLKNDILEVIRKYVNIEPGDVNVMLDTDDNDCQILELNFPLPDKK